MVSFKQQSYTSFTKFMKQLLDKWGKCLTIVCLLVGIMMPTFSAESVQADSRFDDWIEGFRSEAKGAGISTELFDNAFKGLKPDPEVLRLAEYQPEFVTPIWDYLEKRITKDRIESGLRKLTEWKDLLNKIEKSFNVDRHIVVSIWGLESNYGAVLDNPKIIRNVIRSLATLAFGDPDRRNYAKRQLIASLKIVQNGEAALEDMSGSWAGAMGHTQFIPTTFQDFAVDFDGDGKRDIWNSVPDSLASTASYLRMSNWQSGKTWGYEVLIPKKFDYMLADESKSISLADWEKLGIQRATRITFPRPDDKAKMYLPAGANGPAFLILENFNVIKKYNHSDAYALSVGHLADQLRGGGSFVQSWSKELRPLTVSEIKTLQTELNRRGYGAGPVDGKAGPSTRRAIRAYQLSLGLIPDGQPNSDLLERLN